MILSKKGRTLKYAAFCCVYEIMCDGFLVLNLLQIHTLWITRE